MDFLAVTFAMTSRHQGFIHIVAQQVGGRTTQGPGQKQDFGVDDSPRPQFYFDESFSNKLPPQPLTSPGKIMLSPFFSSAVFSDGIADDIELPLHVMKVLQYQEHFQQRERYCYILLLKKLSIIEKSCSLWMETRLSIPSKGSTIAILTSAAPSLFNESHVSSHKTDFVIVDFSLIAYDAVI